MTPDGPSFTPVINRRSSLIILNLKNEKSPIKKWEGAFEHLLSDSKVRLERQKEIEAKLKKDKELPEPEVYKILKKSNKILMMKFKREFAAACRDILK